MNVIVGSTKHKADDIICWRFLEGRRCVKHAELAEARGIDVALIPIRPPVPGDDSGAADGTQPVAPSDAGATVRYAHRLLLLLQREGLSGLVDDDMSVRPGAKYHRWERLGLALRLELGLRELQAGTTVIVISPGIAAAVEASSDSAVQALLQRHASREQQQQAACRAAPPQPAASAGTDANAVAAAGVPALKLASVPASEAAAVCLQLLQAAAAAATSAPAAAAASAPAGRGEGSPPLLPFGCCTKLHLWPELPAVARPCTLHLAHLLHSAAGRPCHCGAAHVSLAELQQEVSRQLQQRCGHPAASITFKTTPPPARAPAHRQQRAPPPAAAAAAAAAAAGQADGTAEGGSDAAEAAAEAPVALFVSGIPPSSAPVAVKQQLLQALANHQPVSVVVPGQRGGRFCKGWAKVFLAPAAAAAALQQLQGQLVVGRAGSAPLQLSHCTGRCDALFPHLPFSCRRQLRVDSVAAFSTTDGPTAAAMAALLAEVAAISRQQQQPQPPETAGLAAPQQQQQQKGLSVADVTACAGGSSMAFLACFDAVAAVELDPDRAEDLLHNLAIIISQAKEQQQQQQQQGASGHEPPPAAATAAAAAEPAAADLLAFRQQDVAYVGILQAPTQSRQQSQQQQQQQQGLVKPGGTAGVVCGDIMQLLPALRQQDVIFVDPPWGGTSYFQQQQGKQQDGAGGEEGELEPPSVPEAQDAPGAPQACSSSSSSSSARRVNGVAAAAMELSGVGLADVCLQLASKCRILAVRLPSRCHDMQAFMKSMLRGVAEREHRQRQRQQLGQEQWHADATLPPVAVRCHYGRADLVIFIHGVCRSRGVCGQEMHDDGQLQCWLKLLRACLNRHKQRSASIIV